jgi:hypothetical protein
MFHGDLIACIPSYSVFLPEGEASIGIARQASA